MSGENTLTIAAIITSIILVAGTAGFVIGSPDVFASIPTSPECLECDEEFFEEQREIDQELQECLDDAEDQEEVNECFDEADEEFQEAFDEWIECLEEAGCFFD